MIRNITIGLLAVVILAASYWGYTSYKDKKAMEVHIENNYQRAFHNLVYHIDLLHDKVGAAFVTNSPEKLQPQFVDIWRLTSIAQSDVNQLPLGLLPFQNTASFLTELNDFTYDTAIRNLTDNPITDSEVDALKKYYEHAQVIKDELREAQYISLNNQLRWTDVELALLDQEANTENDVLDGFRTIEDETLQFSDGFTDNPFAADKEEGKMYEMIKGKTYDESEIMTKAMDMFDLTDEKEVTITESLKGADISNYNVAYTDDNKDIFMDMTAKGAYPVSFIVNRPVEERTMSLHDGQGKGEEFLKEIGFEGLEVIQSQQYDGTGMYTFVASENGVKILADTVGVKVALDTGEIIGLHAREYLKNHKKRDINQPKLTEEEAKSKIHDKLDLQTTDLVLMQNRKDEEVLAYMFTGIMDNETYRVYINAADGGEEKVERLSNTETNFEINQ